MMFDEHLNVVQMLLHSLRFAGILFSFDRILVGIALATDWLKLPEAQVRFDFWVGLWVLYALFLPSI